VSRSLGRMPRGIPLFATLLMLLAALGIGLAGPAAARNVAAAHFGQAAAAGFVAADGEVVGDYQVDIALAEDGSARITETLTQVFPEGQERHGITRDIRVRAGYQNRDDVYRYYQLTDLEVSSPTGAPADVSESDYGAYVHLRIGSPEETVTGTQTYVIAYTMAHIVNEIDATHAEFVHDVVGAANEQTYDKVTARVTSPGTVLRVGCNYGQVGSDSLCDSTLGDPSTFSHSGLAPGEAMTVALSMDRAAFGDLTPDLVSDSTANEDPTYADNSDISPAAAQLLGRLFAGIGVFLPLLAAAAMSMLVWTRGRDEAYAGLTPGLSPGAGESAPTVRQSRPGTIAVQFNPPPGVQPGMVGTLIDEEANTVDVTATILDLAVRGYLSIAETQKRFGRTDWMLTRAAPPAHAVALSTYEEMLVEALFAQGDAVRLSDLKNTFASTLASVKGSMYDEVVRRGWFRSSPRSQRDAWGGFGAALMLLGVISLFFLGTVVPAAVRPIPGVPVSGTGILAGGLFVSGLIVRALGKRMASRTAEGTAVLTQSLGFKQYLVTAEANQIRFEEAQDIFSRYLPYAIVFGVADKWAKTFDEVAAAAAAAGVTIAPPIWYIGPNWGSGGFFDSIASGADSFSTQAAGTFISTPGSSGTSVFDGGGGGFGGGFGGGGFSGGGGSGSSGGTW